MRVGGKVVKPPPSVARPEPQAEVRPDDPPVIEPTRDEQRNGWTREKLTNYMIERAAQQQAFALEFSDKKRDAKGEGASGFDPHRW